MVAEKSKKVLVVGGFKPGQSLWSIQQGFESLAYEVLYVPSRGCIEAHRERDIALAKEEADLIPHADEWDIRFNDAGQFQEGLFQLVEEQRPELLLWWFAKDDRPPGLISALREEFPWCKTVTHTQDDPWDVLQKPHFAEEFEYAVTCCKESLPVYEQRGVKAIVLYPPPAWQLHGTAQPAAGEECDFCVTVMSIYSRSGGKEADYLTSANAIDRITHPIAFPDQWVLRQEVVEALRDLGRIHIYGGLGFGTFEGVPRSSYRGFRTYGELPGVYTAAKVNVNRHNSPQSFGCLNQRDTAITGSGGFMLTDYVEGIEETFDIGSEIDTWKSVEELREKATWWLAHDDERQAAARRAQERIMRDYGNGTYAEKLLRFVKD